MKEYAFNPLGILIIPGLFFSQATLEARGPGSPRSLFPKLQVPWVPKGPVVLPRVFQGPRIPGSGIQYNIIEYSIVQYSIV